MAAGILATLKVMLTGDTSQLTKDMEAAGKKVEAFGDKLTGVGKNLSMRLTLPLIIAGGAAVKMASDFEESLNKVKVVFGPAAQEVINFSQTAATQLGMSSQAALDAAGTFGNLFTAMGMAQGPAAEMSTALLQLAADLASFNNLDPTEVLEKLRSGLVGEVEPLRALGVQLNAATVEAKALELGLADTADALTEADKVTARYALIMEQTKNAQGDFARTSGGLANQMRILKAQFTNAGASIGAVMLPFVQQLAAWIGKLATWFGTLTPGMQKWIVIIGVAAAAIGPLLMIVGSLVSAIGAILPVIGAVVGVISGPVLLVIGAVVAAIAVLWLAWKNNWGGIQDKLKAVWAWLQPILQNIWTWLKVNIPIAIQALSAYWQNVLLPALQAAWAWIQTYIIPVLQWLGHVIGVVVVAYVQTMIAVWRDYLIPALQAAWNWIQTYIIPALQWLGNVIGVVVTAYIRTLVNIWQNVLMPAFQAVWSFIQSYLVPIFQLVSQIIGQVVVLAVQVLVGYWQNILWPALQRVWSFIQTYLVPIFQIVAQVVGVLVTNAVQGLVNMWNVLWGFLQGKIMPILKQVADFITLKVIPVVQFFTNLIGVLLVGAFNALKSMLDWIIQKLQKLASALSSLQLPAWATPGSPTPFELGIRGMIDALDQLNRVQLPELATSMATLDYRLPEARQGTTTSNNWQFNQTIYTNSQGDQTVGGYQRLKAMAG
jgi:hypothetical protein